MKLRVLLFTLAVCLFETNFVGFSQCTNSTASGTYCAGQYAEYKVTDASTTTNYHWYELVGTEYKDRGYGLDGTGRNFVSVGTVTGATTYYYSKETDQTIVPSIAPNGGTTQLMAAGKYAMPFSSTTEFKLNSVEVVVSLTSATNVYGFQIMYSNTDSVQTFSEWFTGTRDEFTPLGGNLYRVEIPVTGITISKGIGQSLEFRSVANAGQNVAVDGMYWWNNTGYNGGSYATNTITLADPEKTIGGTVRTPLISNWNMTTICDKIGVTSTLSGSCCVPVGANFTIRPSSYSTFPTTLTASGTDITTPGFNYYWYDANNTLLGSGVDKKTLSITSAGIYTLRVVRNAADLNKFSCVGRKIFELENKTIKAIADTTICIGDPFLLSAFGAEGNYAWSSPNATANTAIVSKDNQNTAINLTTPGKYTFVVSGDVKLGNIAYDGKFDKYDDRTNYNIVSYPPSFETTYGNTTSSPPGAFITNNNQFRVDKQIKAWSDNQLFCNTPAFLQKTDPISGDIVDRGNIYYADANTSGTEAAYSEAYGSASYLWQLSNQPVKPNTDYEFSMDVSEWNSSTNPDIMLLVNGVALPLFVNNVEVTTATKKYWTFDGTPCTWKTLIGKWNSGSNTSATITVSEVSKVNSGHEFAMDDITFSSGRGTQYDTVEVTIQDCFSVTASGDSSSVCAGNPLTLNAKSNGFIEKWETSTGTLVGNTPTLKVYPATSTVYTVTAKFPVANLFTNSDFSKDNEGVESTTGSLTYKMASEPGSGEYSVVYGNESWLYNTFVGGDHTTGTGKFLLAKVNSNTQNIIFRKTIAVTAGQSYGVSYFIANYSKYPTNDGPASVQLRIGGTVVQSLQNATTTWNGNEYMWTATATGNVAVEIISPSESRAKVIALDDVRIGRLGMTKVANVSVATRDCGFLTARTDTTVCLGGTVRLSANTNGFITGWSPSTGLSDASIPNPVATISASTTYTVSAKFPLQRFFANGAFSDGDVGFTNGLGKASSGQNINDNQYAIGTGNDSWLNYPFQKPTTDHTTGTGLMMIAKTKTGADRVVFSQTITATAGQSYALSFWTTDMHQQLSNSAPLSFAIRVGGTVLKTVTYPQDRQWRKMEVAWTATATGNVTIEILSPRETTGDRERAFGLDDVTLALLGNTKTRQVVITGTDCNSVIPMPVQTVCIGDPLKLYATTKGYITKWGPAAEVSTPNNPTPVVYPIANTTYTVEARFVVNQFFNNSNFSNGNSGIDAPTGVTFRAYGTAPGANEYGIVFGNENWLYYPHRNGTDHTTGNGQYMLVNANTDVDRTVFRKTFTATAGEYYALSFYLANYHTDQQNGANVRAQIKVNGTVVKTVAIPKDYNWNYVEHIWASTVTGNVTVEIVSPRETNNQTRVMAVDDLYLSQLGLTKTASVAITVQDCFQILAERVGNCVGDSIQIKATTNGLFKTWTVISGNGTIAKPTSATAWIKPTAITQVEATAEFQLGNTLFNGDFEQGNVGFTSDYTVSTGGFNSGNYAVDNKSSKYNGLFIKDKDHTTGSGLMFISDGGTDVTKEVYRIKVKVEPNKSYAFSVWIANIIKDAATSTSDPSISTHLAFVIGGQLLGDIKLPMDTAWHEFHQTFTTPANLATDSIEIAIQNRNTAGYGNDFALDDMVFAPLFNKTKKDTVTVPACIVCKPVTAGVLTPAPATICQNQNTVITGATPTQENNTTFTYKWEQRVGTGAYTTIASAVGKDYTTPTLTQTTRFRRTAIGALGCTDTSSVLITVNPKPNISAVTSKAAYCEGDTLNLKARNAVTGQTMTYNWSVGATLPGTAVGAGANVNVKPAFSATPYRYTVIGVSSVPNGACRDTTSVNVTINTKPNITINTDKAAYCEGENITLSYTNASGNTATISSQVWSKGASALGTASTQAVNNVKVSDAVAYSVIVTSGNGCKDTASVTPVINSTPFKPSIRANSVCKDAAFTGFVGNASPTHTLQWHGIDSNSVAGAVPVPPTNAVGNTIYYVSQRHNTTGCVSGKDSVEVVVKALPTPVIVGNATTCEDSVVTYSIQSANATSTFAWTYSGASEQSANTNKSQVMVRFLPNVTSATLSVIETSTNGCSNTPAVTRTIAVDEKPPLSNAGTDFDVCAAVGTFQLTGNDPAPKGLGAWTKETISTGGAITTASSYNSGVTGLAGGQTLVATWRVRSLNNYCKPSTSTVSVTATSIANPTVLLNPATTHVCAGTSVTLTATPVSPGATTEYTFYNAANNSVLRAKSTNPTYTFNGSDTVKVYVVLETNSLCVTEASKNTVKSDSVLVIVDALPTTANAGANDDMCGDDYTLGGNQPLSGKGKWASSNPLVTFKDGNDSTYNAVAQNMPKGATVTFTWKIDNGKCLGTPSQVQITRFGDLTTPDAGNDTTICAGGSVNLVAKSVASTLNGETQAWLNASKASLGANRITPAGPFTTAGTFKYYYKIENSLCGSKLDSMLVTVVAPPTANITAPVSVQTVLPSFAASNTYTQKDAPVVVTAGTVATGYAGSWTITDAPTAGPAPTTTATTATINNLGAFDDQTTVAWTVKDNTTPTAVCPSAVATLVITRKDFTVSNPKDTVICESAIAGGFIVTGNVAQTDNLEGVKWTALDGGTIAYLAPDSSRIRVTGLPAPTTDSANYRFEYSITNKALGNTSTNVATVKVYKNSTVPVISTNSGADITMCGSDQQLDIQAAVSGRITWTNNKSLAFSNASTSSTLVSGFTNATGTVDVTVSVKNGTCPAETDNINIIRSGELTSPSLVSVNGLYTICKGDFLDMSGNAAQTSTNSEFSGWKFNPTANVTVSDTTASNDNTAKFTFAEAGEYDITYKIGNPTCGIKLETKKVTVIAPPVAEITVPQSVLPGASGSYTFNINPQPITATAAGTGYVGEWVLTKNIGTKAVLTKPTISSDSSKGTLETNAVDRMALDDKSTLVWTVKDAGSICPASSATIELIRKNATQPDVKDDSICVSSLGTYVLKGNGLVTGETATWKFVSSVPAIATPTLTNVNMDGKEATISGVSIPTNAGKVELVFEYSVVSPLPGVTTTPDQMKLTVYEAPELPTTGSTISTCAKFVTLTGNIPSQPTASGKWTIVTGQGQLTDATNATTSLTNLDTAGTTDLTWTISNHLCSPPSVANLKVIQAGIMTSPIITVTGGIHATGRQVISTGTVDTLCADKVFQVEGNAVSPDPTKAETGTWKYVSGPFTIANVTSRTQSINPVNANADSPSVWQWIISSGVAGCNPETTTVTLLPRALPAPTITGDPSVCEDVLNSLVSKGTFTVAPNSTLASVISWADTTFGTVSGIVDGTRNTATANYKFKSTAISGIDDAGFVRVKVSNACGATKAENPVIIKLTPRTVSDTIGGDGGTICSNFNGIALAIKEQVNTTGYDWKFDGKPIFNTQFYPSVPVGNGYDSAFVDNSFWNNFASTTVVPIEVTLKNACGTGVKQPGTVTVTKATPLIATLTSFTPKEINASDRNQRVCLPNQKTKFIASNGNLIDLADATYTFFRNGVQVFTSVADSLVYLGGELNDKDKFTVTVASTAGCFTTLESAPSQAITIDGYKIDTTMTVTGDVNYDGTTYILCSGDRLNLKVAESKGFDGYKWYQTKINGQIDSLSGQSIILSDTSRTGEYYVKIFNKVCDADSSRNVKVKVYEKPSFEFTTDPLVIIYQEGIKVPMPVLLKSPTIDTLTETRWSNETWLEFPTANKVYPLIVPKREQTELTYSLYVKTGPPSLLNCSTERSIVVINALPLLIPNAFSPNGDGVNDTWVINGLNKYTSVTVSVFNRWGNRVFYSTDSYTPWDGTVNGIPMSSGTYYAIVELKGSPDNEDGNFTKALTIVR